MVINQRSDTNVKIPLKLSLEDIRDLRTGLYCAAYESVIGDDDANRIAKILEDAIPPGFSID